MWTKNGSNEAYSLGRVLASQWHLGRIIRTPTLGHQDHHSVWRGVQWNPGWASTGGGGPSQGSRWYSSEPAGAMLMWGVWIIVHADVWSVRLGQCWCEVPRLLFMPMFEVSMWFYPGTVSSLQLDDIPCSSVKSLCICRQSDSTFDFTVWIATRYVAFIQAYPSSANFDQHSIDRHMATSWS